MNGLPKYGFVRFTYDRMAVVVPEAQKVHIVCLCVGLLTRFLCPNSGRRRRGVARSHCEAYERSYADAA